MSHEPRWVNNVEDWGGVRDNGRTKKKRSRDFEWKSIFHGRGRTERERGGRCVIVSSSANDGLIQTFPHQTLPPQQPNNKKVNRSSSSCFCSSALRCTCDGKKVARVPLFYWRHQWFIESARAHRSLAPAPSPALLVGVVLFGTGFFHSGRYDDNNFEWLFPFQ